MMSLTRYLVPVALAASLGVAAIVAPAPAQAQSDDLVRVLVNVADVVLRGNQPYYRYGDYGYDDRLVMQRDRYGRPVYYRYVPYGYNARHSQPYGNAYGYRGKDNDRYYRDVDCNKHGKCKVSYYDPRYDRNDRYDRRDRYYDGRRWRDHDDRD